MRRNASGRADTTLHRLTDLAGEAAPLFALRGVEQLRGTTRTLTGVDLDIPRGEVVALVGPSGAGKTSLLRLLNRLDDPSAGSVSFAGAPITSYPVRQLRRRVGFVFQAPVMLAGTVAANLAIARRLSAPMDGASSSGLTSGAKTDRRMPDDATALRLAGLDAGFAQRVSSELSGGETQRVGIARALACGPEVLLLDEPTSALDPEIADRLMTTVRDLVATHGLSVVMVTHRLAEARQASTVTVVLEAGRVVEVGQTARLFTSPRTERTREYLVGRD
ncbi:MAG: ATP-binding cassette domain-containing protein [Gemmatimonadaceae bacterium]